MEIKIQCSCGSRYKFDVEPVNGRVPAPLACPNCQASWTEHANAMIADSLSRAASSDGTMPASPAAAPVPTAAAPMPPPSPAAPKLGLRLSGHAASETQPAAAPAATPGAEQPAPAPAVRHMPHVPTLAPVVEEHDMGAFWKGVLGALIGALLGGVVYYLLFVHTGARVKLIALGIGFLAGAGARLLGKDRSKELGGIGALLSIVMIVGAQYLVVSKWFHEGDPEDAPKPGKSEYEEQVDEAKKVITAIPNGTDQEIRLYLAKEQADEGEKPDPKSVDPDDIKEFKTEDLPRYRKLTDGTITREQFEKELSEHVAVSAEERQKDKEEGERVFKWVFLAFTMSKFNIVCMIGAAGIAYKMIADA